MVDIIFKEILEVIEDEVNHQLLGNEKLMVIDIKKMQYNLKTLCFSLLNSLKLRHNIHNFEFNSIEEALMKMKGIDLVNNHVINTFNNLSVGTKEHIGSLFIKMIHNINNFCNKVNIGDLYERTLDYELLIYDDFVKYGNNKSSRNQSGAYYTPIKFANISVQKAIDLFIFNNLDIKNFSESKLTYENDLEKVVKMLLKSNIIDFSCGTGSFLLAIINYIKEFIYNTEEQKNELIKKMIPNIWGIDVDYIALQIIKCELISIGESLENIEYINKQFILGNPLIYIDKEEPEEYKMEVFASGMVYNKMLGLNLDNRFNCINSRFELIVGNPPWERIRFEEKKFFSTFDTKISNISQKKFRDIEIEKLKETNSSLYEYYRIVSGSLEEAKRCIENNSKLRDSLAGELNTYAIFTELALNYLDEFGELCLILKSSIVTSANNKTFFGLLTREGLVERIYEFINSKKIFSIDSRERFCVMYLNKFYNNSFLLAMNLTDINKILDLENMSTLTLKEISEINPLTKMLPNISSNFELELLVNLSKKFRKFGKVFSDCKFGRLVHFTNHSDFIHKESLVNTIPIYEGKFFEQYDNKHSTFEGVSYDEKYSNKASSLLMSEERKREEDCYPIARFFIERDKWEQISKNYNGEYSLMWRSLTSSTNTRTMVASILPHMPTSQSVQLLQHNDYDVLVLLLALFNSIVFDYLVKLKLNGIDLTQTIIKQIPVPEVEIFNNIFELNGNIKTIKEHIFDRVFMLLENDTRLQPLFHKLSYRPVKIYEFDKKRIMSELDILISSAYGIELNDLMMIALQFPNFYSEEQCALFFKDER